MATASPTGSNRWLYGPVPDLLLGCGLWYFIAFELFATYGAEIRVGGGLVWAPILMLLLGVPHHGATLLRVYEQRRERRAYAFFSVYLTLLIWGVFAVGVHSPLVGSVVLTVFLTWSPWHYTGQNYGIAVMFLRRNGVDLPPHVKRWLYASFILSFLLTVVVMHHGDAGASYSAVPYDLSGYNFLSLHIPHARYLFVAVGALYLLSLCMAAVLLLRRAGPRQLAPAAWLVASQALWFSIPVAVRSWNVRTGLDVFDTAPEYYFLWIGVAHAAQYLWVTSYYARSGPDWPGQARYFGKALLAGALVWTLPSLVFAPGLLGRLPFDAGLAALIAATVNLHHFVLDGAIWKLRDGRVARILIRRGPEEAGGAEDAAPASAGFGRRLVWATGALCAGVMFVYTWETYFGLRQALPRGNLARVEQALERLAWLGRDNPQMRAAFGAQWLRSGDAERAAAEFQRALQLQETPQLWKALAGAYASQQRWPEAAAAYEAGYALPPRDPGLLHEAAVAWLEGGDAGRARATLERVLDLDPGRESTRQLLASLAP